MAGAVLIAAAQFPKALAKKSHPSSFAGQMYGPSGYLEGTPLFGTYSAARRLRAASSNFV